MRTYLQIVRAQELGVPEEDIQKWLDGGLIQNVMSYLNADEREYILTGISPAEWERLFGEDS